MRIIGIIPARFASNRFPGKALVDIKGTSMVQRVYQQASKSPSLDKVVVATDHQDIYQHVLEFGGQACMTNPDHPSGTDRCYEALELQTDRFDFVINIQGDEPFIQPEQIEDLAASLNQEVQIATLAKKITDPDSLTNPNEVKVIIDGSGKARYFSRSPLPFCRNVPVKQWLTELDYFRHIGIYAYREDVLRKVTTLEISPWEKSEGLEQLRWLYHGYQIKVFTTQYQSLGIDTPEDLQRALESKNY